MLFSRSLRMKLPIASKHLIPEVVSPPGQLSERQQLYTKYFDRNTKTLPLLQADDVQCASTVTENNSLRGRMLRLDVTPRSYVIETEERSTLQRNRRDFIKTAEETPAHAPYIEDPTMTQNASPSPQHSRRWPQCPRRPQPNCRRQSS